DGPLRERLAIWLRAALADTLSEKRGAPNVPVIIRLLDHTAALLRTDDSQQLWESLTNYALCGVCDRLEDLGRLDLVKLALGAVTNWFELLSSETSSARQWLRERSVLLNRQGDTLLDQGDLAGALKAHRDSLAVCERLAQSDPSNAGWQRDL